MQPELLALIQTRMATSYNEQLWAVALVGSMSGFVIVNVDRLIASIDYKKIKSGVWILTILCALFILSRLGVYAHYSNLIDQEYPLLKELSPTMTFFRWMVLSSGALLYICITVGMAIAAVLTCKKADKLKNEPEKFIAQSGKGGFFSRPPHTTRRAGPHRAVQRDYRAVAG